MTNCNCRLDENSPIACSKCCGKYSEFFGKKKPKYDPNAHSTYEIAKKMNQFGGSFVSGLGTLFFRADDINKLKIVTTWENYFDEYSEKFNKKDNENS
jgi:hypothetical protein